MITTTLTFEEGTSSKFYSLALDDKILTIRFGRIGSAGQEKTTKFRSADEAREQYDALLEEKKRKGYVESGGSSGGSGGGSGGSGAKKAARAPAAAAAAAPVAPEALPAPALEDPPVPGLDLAVFRAAAIPAPAPDSAPFEGPAELVVQGYRLSFADDGEVIIADARGKRLRSVPEKLRKHEDYQALMRGRKDDRARGRRARRVLEERMISGAPFTAGEIAWLVEDDAFAPLLRSLLVAPVVTPPAPPGLLCAWDRERGLGLLPLDHDARWIGWVDVELVHPMKLGDVTPWQDLLVDVGLQQELPQAFREVRVLPAAQRGMTESTLLSGRETRSAAVIERALDEEGWITRRGMARRTLSARAGDAVQTVEAWFDYGEYYMPSDPTSSGAFGFVAIGGGGSGAPSGGAAGRKPMKLGEVPAVLLSEAIRSLEVALAQAGAKKDDEEDEGEGEDTEGDADGDGEDGGEQDGDEG